MNTTRKDLFLVIKINIKKISFCLSSCGYRNFVTSESSPQEREPQPMEQMRSSDPCCLQDPATTGCIQCYKEPCKTWWKNLKGRPGGCHAHLENSIPMMHSPGNPPNRSGRMCCDMQKKLPAHDMVSYTKDKMNLSCSGSLGGQKVLHIICSENE